METNLGIQTLCALVTGTVDQLGHTPIPFNAANAKICVGDNLGAVPTVAATDVKLSTLVNGGTNYYNFGMVTGFPIVSGETMEWQIQATSSLANFAWNEFCVSNGTQAQVASNVGYYMLNHKGIALGTKNIGETWSFQAQLTQS